MQCILDEEIRCMRKIITMKDFEEIPECLSLSFSCTANDCLINKDVK